MSSLDTAHIKPVVDASKSITILLSKNPSYDAVAAALACKLSLDASGKVTNIICETPMTVEFNRLIGVDAIDTKFGNRNLIISFHDQTDLVDKVSYNIDEGELKLVITPKLGVQDLDHRRLKFIPGRNPSDLLIIVDVDRLEYLGNIYGDDKQNVKDSKIVSISHRPPSENYTQHQIYQPQASSLSELMANLIESLQLAFHPDAATNLLAGLHAHTKNFQSSDVSYETFEVAAKLLKKGAQRHDVISANDFPAGSIPTKPLQEPEQKPSNQLGYGTDTQPVATEAAPANPPADWYEPKIYHGPMLQ